MAALSLSYLLTYLLILVFETEAHYVTLAGLELTEVCLPCPPEYWD